MPFLGAPIGVFGSCWGLVAFLSLAVALLAVALGAIVGVVLTRVGHLAIGPRVVGTLGSVWGIIAMLVLAVAFWPIQENPPWTIFRNTAVGVALYGTALYATWHGRRILLTVVAVVLIPLNALGIFSYGPFLFLATLLVGMATTLLWLSCLPGTRHVH